ncbi:MAG TPA: 3-hydroxyacyl-CoA dehydrogenase family protein, partial [Bacteroidales bacterium]|nr:3-hydroxyacyl-CoA dehydrogenase family protein [Bacteroidales bacterium]
SDEALQGLLRYVHKQSARKGAKMAAQYRSRCLQWADLDDEGLGQAYADRVLSVIRTSTSISEAGNAGLVFEAVSENPDLKVKLFRELEEAGGQQDVWYFTNTSSVPIHLLDERAGLGGRILGFHFYNPPAVQRLVELILTSSTLPELREVALELARNMGKIIVPANDHAGFIGNGHFMRDALFGLAEAQRLAKGMPLHEAVYMVNTVSAKFLVRPMGIFQLIDYVGIDVVRFILAVMDPYYPNETLHSALLDRLFEAGVKGGQHHDGSQKDGFLKYEEGRPTAVYDPDNGSYVELSTFKAGCEARLGGLPASIPAWKDVVKDPEKEAKLAAYFQDLGALDTEGAALARAYVKRSRDIGQQLVADGIALNEKDVNTVLLTGFFHAYGPINLYLA